MGQLEAALKWIFGEKPDGYYVVGLVFSIIGILISLYWASKKRDISAPSTPEKFSWTFLLWDNVKKAFIVLLVMFLIFRIWDVLEIEWMVGVGVAVALSLDQLLDFIMSNWNWFDKIMSRDRDKFPTRVKDEVSKD